MVHQARAEGSIGVRPHFSHGGRATVTSVLHRILAICLGLISACYSPPQPACGFACQRSGECPTDYFCAPDGICHREGSSPTAACAIDARSDSPRPIDAPLTDADVTPPSVVATQPTDGAANVAVNEVIGVQFDEPVVGVGGTTFRVVVNATMIAGAVSSVDPRIWMFTPSSALPAGMQVDVQLIAGITDYSGNGLAPFSFSFTTAP